ncbi:GNAT family N-acetyltransferase [Candidatus Dojkabacteria bacterium]|uniref:GNAT family N-acetyltransferase n=1 Tax=Candidatus Dojkabacteria bacterium TaxID=2099670 RepID=A0A955RHI1_9BACT|nr:GNAT family N-acetyltransferase [Candidatus Dojkabacteria bacterium]
MDGTAVEEQPNIIVNALKQEDIPQLYKILEQRVIDQDTGKVFRDEILDIIQNMAGIRDKDNRRRQYLVARDGDRILGCMAYSVPDMSMCKHFGFEHPATADAIELLNAFVLEQEKGVGKKLFEAICQTGRSLGKSYLLVNSGPRYRASWGFYDKMCDESYGLIENKYGEGRHAKTWRISL